MKRKDGQIQVLNSVDKTVIQNGGSPTFQSGCRMTRDIYFLLVLVKDDLLSVKFFHC